MKSLFSASILLPILVISFCIPLLGEALQKPQATTPGKLQIRSPAFKNKGAIPRQYTCDGEDIPPPLQISGVPKGTKSLVLIVDDPDAPGGTFVHWLLWNLPPQTKEIGKRLPPKAIQGTNDFGRLGYGGPCPPFGTHRYRFQLYALDTTLSLRPSARKADLEKAMKGHILGQALLLGLYSRRR